MRYQSTCLGCGVALTAPFPSQIRRYCSQRCAYDHRPRLPEKVCPQCGATYQPDKAKRLYCSPACQAAALTAANAERRPTQTCEQCGREFPMPAYLTRKRRQGIFCSPACRAAALPDFAARFWAKVDQSGGPDMCWPWTGGHVAAGYGVFGLGGRKGGQTTAHRVALLLSEGRPIEALRTETREGLHRCDNPPCCNPAHLFWGTQAENLEDMRQKGRRRRTGPPGGQLTAEAVVAIRARYAAGGISQTALAAEYGVHQSGISAVLARRTWKHV